MWKRVRLIFKSLGFSVAMFGITHISLAQEKTVFTQYMYNGLAINPAYAGHQNILSATVLHRQQWVGLEGAPNTQTLTMHTASKKKKIGLGLFVMRDQIGVHSDLNLYGSYAYKIRVSRKAILSMGIQAGFNSLSSNYARLNKKDIDDPNFAVIANKFSPNFGAGVYYYLINKGYVGFSIPYLIKSPVLPKEVNSLGQQARYHLLTAGYVFDLNSNVKVKPSTLIRIEEGAPLGFDLNANLILKERVFLGYSYRSGDAMSMMLQLQLNENFQLGYSYDFTTSRLNKFSKGSHEFMLNYRRNLFPEKCSTYL